WTHDEAIGRLVAETILPPGAGDGPRSGVELFARHGADAGSGRRTQLHVVHRDGRHFPVEMTSWTVPDGQGTRFNAFLHDITERKQFEAKLEHQALHDHLTGLANRA